MGWLIPAAAGGNAEEKAAQYKAAAEKAAAEKAAAAGGAAEIPLGDMVEKFKRELALQGSMQEVVTAACAALGVETGNIGLKEQAQKCYMILHHGSTPQPIGKPSP